MSQITSSAAVNVPLLPQADFHRFGSSSTHDAAWCLQELGEWRASVQDRCDQVMRQLGDLLNLLESSCESHAPERGPQQQSGLTVFRAR
ncbi:MAG: hypothetical protein KDA85_12325 [Planctomycetaceae bacterium]|nr:hypothetical protein [Planctomycetaceae bacterium]